MWIEVFSSLKCWFRSCMANVCIFILRNRRCVGWQDRLGHKIYWKVWCWWNQGDMFFIGKSFLWIGLKLLLRIIIHFLEMWAYFVGQLYVSRKTFTVCVRKRDRSRFHDKATNINQIKHWVNEGLHSLRCPHFKS